MRRALPVDARALRGGECGGSVGHTYHSSLPDTSDICDWIDRAMMRMVCSGCTWEHAYAGTLRHLGVARSEYHMHSLTHWLLVAIAKNSFEKFVVDE